MKPIQTKSVKRVEIIISSLELKTVLAHFEDIGVTGYSIIRNVIGKGDRGSVSEEEELGLLGNDYVLVICDAEKAALIQAMLLPILERYGGVCLISEAEWLIHREMPLFD